MALLIYYAGPDRIHWVRSGPRDVTASKKEGSTKPGGRKIEILRRRAVIIARIAYGAASQCPKLHDLQP